MKNRRKKFAIDLTVTLVVEELSSELSADPTVLLKEFVASKTGALLYDDSSKLWWRGSSDIAEMYKKRSILRIVIDRPHHFVYNE